MLRGLGWWRLAVLIASALAGLWYLAVFVTTSLQALLIAGFTVSVLGSVHLSRGDGRFLKTLRAPAWTLYSIEYTAYASPIIVLLFIIGEPLAGGVLLAGCVILPVFRLSDHRGSKNRRPMMVPRRDFEWIAGLRKTWPFFALVYLLGAVFVRYPFSIPAALVILAVLGTSYFHVGEGRPMMEVLARAPRSFVLKKTVSTLGVFWMYCSPLLLLFLAFHIDYWIFLLVVSAGCSILLITAVFAKYAFFVEGERFSNPHTVVTTVSLSCMLLFVPAPAAVALAVWLYFRAVGNLKTHLEPVST
jgi:hypothetical protein